MLSFLPKIGLIETMGFESQSLGIMFQRIYALSLNYNYDKYAFFR